MSDRELEKRISFYIPLPVCIINRQGKVLEASGKIGEVFIYEGIEDSDIFALTGIKTAELYEAASKGEHPLLRRNDRVFRLLLQKMDTETEETGLAILFDDVTGMEELKDMYRNEKMCFAKVQVDNYDELTSGAGAESRLALSSEIDKIIRKWGAKASASVNRIRNNAYVICFEQQHLDKLAAAKFDILDE
ncbi:MAG: DHH family phosphoesterase, partial [Firmicutes bacterium]|nr:DHH family phosphoesterase [Bacillota bacterium]